MPSGRIEGFKWAISDAMGRQSHLLLIEDGSEVASGAGQFGCIVFRMWCSSSVVTFCWGWCSSLILHNFVHELFTNMLYPFINDCIQLILSLNTEYSSYNSYIVYLNDWSSCSESCLSIFWLKLESSLYGYSGYCRLRTELQHMAWLLGHY
jgi:hypothetical protein